jgi:NTP pyrophosphatase (non-canonical NTP hydrolase)
MVKKKSPAELNADSDELHTQGGEPLARVKIVSKDSDADDFEVMAADTPEGAAPGQLFRSDALLLPEAHNTYRKPVAAIHSIPERRDASLKLTARKLMEAMPLAVQLDLRSRRKEEAQELIRKIREERATPLFEIRTAELCRLAGISGSNKDRIYDTLAEMVAFPFVWNVLGEDGEVEFETVAPFLIRRDKGVGKKLGYIRFAFEPEILLWFLEPTMWANLSWTVMSGIGRSNGPGQEAAFGLYQNIWRYIGTSAKLTPLLDVATWIDLIIGPSRFVKVDSKGVKQVVDYKDFKRRYLLPGLAILNDHPALNHTVELKEDKAGGRKVARLRFKFVEKVQGTFDFPLGWPPEVLKQLTELGFSEKEISTASQLYPYEQVAEALKRLPAAEQRVRAKGSRVYSRKGFFGGILANVAKGEAQTAEEEAKLLKEAEQLQQQEVETQRMEALQAKFSTHQRNMIGAELNALPEKERDALIQKHLEAKPEDRILYKAGEFGTPYLALFCKWLAGAHPETYAAWLPELKDQSFQSWLAWQVMNR